MSEEEHNTHNKFHWSVAILFRLGILVLAYAKDYIGAIVLLILSMFHINATSHNDLNSSVDWIIANRVVKKPGLSANIHQLIGIVTLILVLYCGWMKFYKNSTNYIVDQFFNNYMPLMLVWVAIGNIIRYLLPRNNNNDDNIIIY